jgi:large subunit ribosomal protein L25
VKLQGGILEHVLREISVRCLADRIPVSVDVDVSAMGISENVTVGSLRVPEGAEVLDDPKHIVVNILAPAAEEEKAPAEGSEAEPEVIAKGKEKGEDGEAAAKPEAAKKEEPKK